MIGVLRRIPLSLRVPLLACALMVLVGFVASQQVLVTLGKVQNAHVRELAQQQIKALSVALGPHVLRNDIWEIYDTLDRSTSETEGSRMTFTAIANTQGAVLASTNPRLAPLDSPMDMLTENAQSPDTLSVSSENTHIRLLAPLVYQGRTVGQILTEMNVEDLVAERKQAGQLLLLGNAVVTGILALLGYFAMHRMLMPITRLARHMRDTSDTPEPIPERDLPRGDTEVSRLVKTYNQMAGAVGAKAEMERRLAARERFVSLGRLSSSLAHEINNPLGGLLNAADTIRQYSDRPEVVQQSAEILTRGLNHMRDVARVTLEQNRLDRASAKMTLEDFDDLRLLISPEIARKSQILRWEVAASAEAVAQFAAAPLRQIALNLLLNATSAAPEAGEVVLTVSENAAELCLAFSDNGPGLPNAARARLLSDDPVAPGGGVGLRLVRELVRELSGSVRFDREEGRTTVMIDLPFPAAEATSC